jgi:hypothetical protein
VEGDEERQTRLWYTENLAASVSRYLNSGNPCILAREEGPDEGPESGHAQVICGYLTREDVIEEELPSGDEEFSRIVAFIVSDDQKGPLETVWLRDLVDELLDDYSNLTLLVPLPRGLWLSGRAAESQGAALFENVVRERSRRLHGWLNGIGRLEQKAAHAQILGRVRKEISSGPAGKFAVRSYATFGSDFKRSFIERLHDVTAARVVGYTPLPKYVWVIEVVDRELRERQPASVRGTIVLDGSAVSAGQGPKTSIPLLAHIPGQISRVVAPNSYRNAAWLPTSLEPYETGRSATDRDYRSSESKIIPRFKGAVVSL